MTPRARAARPWLITAAVCAALVCAVPWPQATGWAVGCAAGTWALVAGVRRFIEEQRPRSSTGAYSSTATRAAAYRECADILRDAHYRDGLTVQEIGTALRNTADHMEQQ